MGVAIKARKSGRMACLWQEFGAVAQAVAFYLH